MKKESQANNAYNEIRRQILIMQLPPQVRLKEDFWSKKLNVSRIAIREALTRLLGEGLVSSGPKGGFFVTDMSKEDVRQIRELREILEVSAVKIAINVIKQEHLDELQKICDDFSEFAEKGYVAGACEADIRFHEKLVESSGNLRLLKVYHFSHIPLFHQKLGKTISFMSDYEQTDKEHRAILDALKNKDFKKAEETLLAHFKRGETAMLDLE